MSMTLIYSTLKAMSYIEICKQYTMSSVYHYQILTYIEKALLAHSKCHPGPGVVERFFGSVFPDSFLFIPIIFNTLNIVLDSQWGICISVILVESE